MASQSRLAYSKISLSEIKTLRGLKLPLREAATDRYSARVHSLRYALSLASKILTTSRFAGDVDLLAQLHADEMIAQRLSEHAAVKYQSSMRTHLLSNAVRVDKRLVPAVAAACSRLKGVANLKSDMEIYIFDDASVNAFVTEGNVHTLVALSSGAVNNLSETELDFVIGHELGHAVFGHVEVGVQYVLQTGEVEPRACMQLLAWQRAAEISADRVGLICCGSLEAAATALFKTLSGLHIDGLSISPAEFAEQWEHLENEVIEGGDSDHWQLTHPFPPLRMKAMMLFWESGNFDPEATASQSFEKADSGVHRLLALMDPLAREKNDSSDPMLADYFLWGGIYIALANGEFHQSEIKQIASITSLERVKRAVKGGVPDSEHCLKQFVDCLAQRRKKLKATELHRLMQGLLEVAIADGEIDDLEKQALETLGSEVGVNAAGCEMLVTRFLEER